jgi:hypothetical protein
MKMGNVQLNRKNLLMSCCVIQCIAQKILKYSQSKNILATTFLFRKVIKSQLKKLRTNFFYPILCTRLTKNLPTSDLSLDGYSIPWSDRTKHLGLILDKKLTFSPHFD